MTLPSHGPRTVLRRGLAAAALAAVSVAAQAQPYVPSTISNNTAGFGAWYFAGGAKIGTSGLSLAPMQNTPINPDNLSGWTRAGNFGVAPGATGVTVSNNADFSVPGSGKTAPIKVVAKITPASLGGALSRFAFKAAPGISTAYALGELMQELGVLWEAPQQFAKDTIIPGQFQYCVGEGSSCWFNPPGFQSSPAAVCADRQAAYTAAYPAYTWTITHETNDGSLYGYCKRVSSSPSGFGYGSEPIAGVEVVPPSNEMKHLTEQELADLIAEKSGWPTSSNVANAVREALNAGESVQVNAPTVTGPGSVTGPKQTTNNLDGSRQEKQTVHNITYQGSTISITTTTTTNYFNSSNVQTGSETTTSEETPPPEDPCKANPDTLGCQKLDDPEQVEVPTKEKNVAWTPMELGFGSGSCPSPIQFTTSLGSYSLPFTEICDMLATIVKPLVLLMASLGAAFIILPRET